MITTIIIMDTYVNYLYTIVFIFATFFMSDEHDNNDNCNLGIRSGKLVQTIRYTTRHPGSLFGLMHSDLISYRYNITSDLSICSVKNKIQKAVITDRCSCKQMLPMTLQRKQSSEQKCEDRTVNVLIINLK